MKKLQCSVCGSTDIKKIDNNLFECQSCGVQYSDEEAKSLLVEITGTVQIDKTQDVENAIKRAEQFASEGNVEKAEEYYNKALDDDPDNEVISKKLENLVLNKQANAFILSADITKDAATLNILNGLRALPNVAPNIYNNLEIVKNDVKYYPFMIKQNVFDGSANCISCYDKQIPYQERVERYETVDGKTQTHYDYVTKYRTETDRVQSSANYSFDCKACISFSDELMRKFTNLSPSDFDKASSLYLQTGSNQKEFICKKLTDGVDAFGDYIESNMTRFDVTLSGEEAINRYGFDYDNAPLDNVWLDYNLDKYQASTKAEAERVAFSKLPGDRIENYNNEVQIESDDSYVIYMPVMVLEYKYNNVIYTAYAVLNSGVNITDCEYPMHKDLNTAIQTFCSQKKKSTGITNGLFYGAIGTLVVGLITTIITAVNDPIEKAFPVMLIVFCVLGCIGCIAGAFINKNRFQMVERLKTEEISGINAKCDADLEKSYTDFSVAYDIRHDINLALSDINNAKNYRGFDVIIRVGSYPYINNEMSEEQYLSQNK